MENHPLLRSLANWQGRGPAQLAFGERGFAIHLAWQNRIIQFCGGQETQVLNRYWDEVALETMQSLGQGDPDQRVFVIQPTHRSTFLDRLFDTRDFWEPRFPSPPLVRCLFDREKRILLDAEFRQNETAFFDHLQKSESERLGIETAGWSGRKRDAVPFVEQFCRGMAFQPHRNRWRKTIDSGLVFEVGVDLAGNPYCSTPPLLFRIFHMDDPKYVFEMAGAAVLHRLIPGFVVYGRCNDASDYVLGIRAHVELFDVIAGSFRQVPRDGT